MGGEIHHIGTETRRRKARKESTEVAEDTEAADSAGTLKGVSSVSLCLRGEIQR
jgi:hypothetical protein